MPLAGGTRRAEETVRPLPFAVHHGFAPSRRLRMLIPVLVGPTGVGKSEVAFRLARRRGLEILSADAFQVYRGLSTATAQPPWAWRREVPHHLVDFLDPWEGWSAGEFARRARKVVEARRAAGKTVLVVGGSGFYLRALFKGLGAAPPDPEARRRVLAEWRRRGPEGAHAWLAELDPSAAARVHPSDRSRVTRALERALAEPAPGEGLPPWKDVQPRYFGLMASRDRLKQRILERAGRLWEEGLLEEVRILRKMGLPPEAPVRRAMGVEEAWAFLDGRMEEAEARRRLFLRTRRYAKRQETWFRNQEKVEWLRLEDFSSMEEVSLELEKRIFG